MQAEVAADIARALLTAYGGTPALALQWAAALSELPDPRGWAIQQPHGDPEAVILTAEHICRVTVMKPPSVEAGASGLVMDRFRIDDSIRLISRSGEWMLTFPRIQAAIVLKEEPLPAGQPPGQLRALVTAIWHDLPEKSRGSVPS
jgi:hypothetical protein